MLVIVKNKKEFKTLFSGKTVYGKKYPKSYPCIVYMTAHAGFLETYYEMTVVHFPKGVHQLSYLKGLKRGMAIPI